MTTAPPGLIEKFESWDQENRRLSEKRESKIAWSPPGLEKVPSPTSEQEELEELPDQGISRNTGYSTRMTKTKKDRRGSGRRMSFETVRRMSANITKMFTRRGSASQDDGEKEYKGRVFWLHHGECTNDEKNALTGVIDASLTEFGIHQAAKAGRDLARIVSDSGHS